MIRCFFSEGKTKVTLKSISQVDKIEDDFFKKVALKRTPEGQVILPDNEEEKKKRISDERKSAQNSIDTEVKKAIGSTPYLKDYLKNRFALKNGQQVHNLVF